MFASGKPHARKHRPFSPKSRLALVRKYPQRSTFTVLFCSSTSRDTDNNDRNGICPPPGEIRINVFIFPIRAARASKNSGGSFHIPDRPLRPATFPHRAVPRRTAPSHTGPHPCFVLFQREPPLFCLPQRAARRKMRVTKRQFALATNEPIPKGCCFFFLKGLPEWVRAAGRPFCHGVIHKRSWLYLPFSKTSNFPYPNGSPGILRAHGRPVERRQTSNPVGRLGKMFYSNTMRTDFP